MSPAKNPFNRLHAWSLGCTALLFLTGLTGSLTGAIQPNNTLCHSNSDDGPMQVTSDCLDPLYHAPIYTHQSDEPSPIKHRKISGYFNGTEIDFNIYLPYQGWDGRFFQLVYPTQNSTATSEAIGFGADSGGYTVHVAGTGGYRSDAAVAKISREVAADFYNAPSRKIYGYVYGGSGGSLKTVGAMENTFGVWDGAVVLIQAVPVSNPDDFSVAALGGLVLDSKAAQVQDAVSPGASEGLDEILTAAELSIFEEVTALGLPPGAWEDFDGVARNRTQLYESLRSTAVALRSLDPTYADDFWSQPGYLGVEDSDVGNLFRAALIDFNATIRTVNRDADNIPVDMELDTSPLSAPRRNWYDFTFQSECNGIEGESTFTGRMDPQSTKVSFYPDTNSTILTCLAESSQIRVDNRWFLALHALHRHEVPTRKGFYGYDYLRHDDGTPRYPQRSTISSSFFSESASGGATHTGNITAKMIVMDNLLDSKAFPWQADWYRTQVQKALGDRFSDNYRIYYSDNADHEMGPVVKDMLSRRIDFTGLYEQHLRDLSAWVENGTEPPTPTSYEIRNSQVKIPASARQRAGIQPVVTMEIQIQNSTRADVQVGSPVTIHAVVEVPPGAGQVVSVEWDLMGNGTYVAESVGEPKSVARVSLAHAYAEAGTYFPAVRVASHRLGDMETPYALAYNLGRARVVVRE